MTPKRKTLDVEESVTEKWYHIKNFSQYRVSNYGRIKRSDSGLIIVVTPPDDIQTAVHIIDDLGNLRNTTIHYLLQQLRMGETV